MSLSSVILIEDNPVERAEVQAHCPEVLIFPFPQEVEKLPQLLKHFWAFDQVVHTTEDEQRTRFYQQEQQRQTFSQVTLSLQDFLDGLNLQVHLTQLEEVHLTRAAQLTQRTNQFNVTTIRRTEQEIWRFCQEEQSEGLIIHVEDRFGEYGLVGLVLCTTTKGTLQIDTFLLSCRVLGRGVEHQVVAQLGLLAYKRRLDTLTIPYLPTAKNQPAYEFLDQIGSTFKTAHEQGWLFTLPVHVAAQLRYMPITAQEHEEQPEVSVKTLSPHAKDERRAHLDQALLTQIATELDTVDKIYQRLCTQKLHRIRPRMNREKPRTMVEEELLAIWTDLLKLDPQDVSIDDNFFALGGHSLLATQALSHVQKIFQVELPLRSLFEKPTIAEMALVIEQMQHEMLSQAEDERLAQMLIEIGGLSEDDMQSIFTDTPKF